MALRRSPRMLQNQSEPWKDWRKNYLLLQDLSMVKWPWKRPVGIWMTTSSFGEIGGKQCPVAQLFLLGALLFGVFPDWSTVVRLTTTNIIFYHRLIRFMIGCFYTARIQCIYISYFLHISLHWLLFSLLMPLQGFQRAAN